MNSTFSFQNYGESSHFQNSLAYISRIFGLFDVCTYIHIRTKVGNCLGFRLNQIGSNSGRIFRLTLRPNQENVFKHVIRKFKLKRCLISRIHFKFPKLVNFEICTLRKSSGVT